jgi:uncharacterized protein YozE (UPF0346 family)
MAKAFAGGLYNEKAIPEKKTDFDVLPFFDKNNAQVFFDIEIGVELGIEGNTKGRVVFELFTKQVPKTSDNFLKISNGDNDKNLTYQFNIFHRVIHDFMA